MFPRKPSKILVNGHAVDPFGRFLSAPAQETPVELVAAVPPPRAPATTVADVPQHYAPSHNVLIGAGVEFNGELRNCVRLVVSGRVTGTLIAEDVLIHQNAHVDAAVIATRADVFGKVEGRLVATESVRFRETASFDGRLVYTKLFVETGASLTGQFSRSLDADEQRAVEDLTASRTKRQANGGEGQKSNDDEAGELVAQLLSA